MHYVDVTLIDIPYSSSRLKKKKEDILLYDDKVYRISSVDKL